MCVWVPSTVLKNLETALAGGIGTDVTCQLVTKRFDPI